MIGISSALSLFYARLLVERSILCNTGMAQWCLDILILGWAVRRSSLLISYFHRPDSGQTAASLSMEPPAGGLTCLASLQCVWLEEQFQAPLQIPVIIIATLPSALLCVNVLACKHVAKYYGSQGTEPALGLLKRSASPRRDELIDWLAQIG
ncbi:hypothetical protein SRHO_G00120180 [Serrasalmus rhombeus]